MTDGSAAPNDPGSTPPRKLEGERSISMGTGRRAGSPNRRGVPLVIAPQDPKAEGPGTAARIAALHPAPPSAGTRRRSQKARPRGPAAANRAGMLPVPEPSSGGPNLHSFVQAPKALGLRRESPLSTHRSHPPRRAVARRKHGPAVRPLRTELGCSQQSQSRRPAGQTPFLHPKVEGPGTAARIAAFRGACGCGEALRSSEGAGHGEGPRRAELGCSQQSQGRRPAGREHMESERTETRFG
jgi:hypothetical protein